MPFRLPTQVTLRSGARHDLPGLVTGSGAHHVLLVSDAGLASTPWLAQICGLLAEAGAHVTTATHVEPNPRADTLDQLAEGAREEGVDLVVALGGGSALDAGKAIAMLTTNPGGIRAYEGRERFRHAPLPFLALPTTCGTGSEVTWVSVVSVPEQGRKISVKGARMFPTHALVDPDLLATLPADLVAWTGLDALTHAVEATTCRAANPVSDALASQAIELIFRHLPRAHAAIATDAEARLGMATASCLAGMAFGNADVAGVHCLSESLGGLLDVPHGLANAILLAPVLRVQQPGCAGRLAALAERIGAPSPTPEAFIAAVEALVASLGVPGFHALGVSAGQLPALAAMAEANGSNGSNAVPMDAAAYEALLRSL